MKPNKARDSVAFCLGIVLLGCLIQAAGYLKGDALVFPGVGEILRAFIRLLGAAETWGKIGTTVLHLTASVAIAAVLGTALGMAMGMNAFVRNLLRPTMILLRSLPMIVLTVIVMVLMNYSRVPVTASVLVLTPLIAEAASEGCRRIDRELIDVYRLNSALNPAVLFRVYLPLTAGYLKQAYVNAVGMGIRLAVSTEYLVQTKNSLGKAVYSAGYFNEYQDIYAYALIMVLLVLAVSALPPLIGRLAGKEEI